MPEKKFRQPLSGKQQNENIDVIADLVMYYIRPALNVCVALSRYVLFYFIPLNVYCFGSIISVTLPARPCVTYQILPPWLARTWKFPHPVFLPFVVIFKSVKLRNFDL